MPETMLDSAEKVNNNGTVTKKRPGLTVITASISPEFRDRVERAAQAEQRSISNLINRALTIYIAELEAQGLLDGESR